MQVRRNFRQFQDETRGKPHATSQANNTNTEHRRSGALRLFRKLPDQPTTQEAKPINKKAKSRTEKLFRRNAFKPVSIRELVVKGLDFKSAKDKLEGTGKYRGKGQGIVNVEIIRIPTQQDHVQILYAKHPNEASNPKLAVFVAGQHGKVVQHIDSGEVLKQWESGKSICLTSVRGYMGNPGKPDHIGQAKDLSKILNYLHDVKGILAENTELYAHSMGCDTLTNALAIRANERTGLAEEIYSKINLRAPYKNMVDMIMHKIDTIKLFQTFLWWHSLDKSSVTNILEPIVINSFNNLKHLKAQHIEVIASEADQKVPYRMSKEVFEELKRLNNEADNTKLVTYPLSENRSHDDTCFHYAQAS